MITAMPFGETLLSWRVFRGMTQEQLAGKAGVPRPNLSDMERGRREVTLGTLRVLASALGVRPGVLADGEGPDGAGIALSREAMERIALSAVRGVELADPRENGISSSLRTILAPRLGNSRVPARRANRDWLALRAAFPKEVIESLVRRAVERMGEMG